MELSLGQLSLWTGGEILRGSPETKFNHFNFDSRMTKAGELFFALQGKRDGHNFVLDAWKKGAAGAVVSYPVDGLPENFALLRVEDTLKALQTIASYVLLSTKAKVIAITGSVGKTTTKELIAGMLATNYRVLKSEKNYNNEIGLPMTLLRLTPQDEIVVLEMAMRGPGQIRRLTEIAPPDIAVLTGIHPVHLEFFPSMEALAEAKKEILMGTKADGIAVLNGDDPWVMKIAVDWPGQKIHFGFSEHCRIRSRPPQRLGFEGLQVHIELDRQSLVIKFPFLYEGSVYNLLAACAVALLFSIPIDSIAKVAQSIKPEIGRGELINLKPEIKLVDDTYNSNPHALEEALRSLAKLPASRRLAILGDMLELGPQAPSFHREVGKKFVEYGWDFLFTVGEISQEIAKGAKEAGLNENRISSFKNCLEAAEAVESVLQPGDLVLVKGSRAMKLETIVDFLKARRGEG